MTTTIEKRLQREVALRALLYELKQRGWPEPTNRDNIVTLGCGASWGYEDIWIAFGLFSQNEEYWVTASFLNSPGKCGFSCYSIKDAIEKLEFVRSFQPVPDLDLPYAKVA